MARRFARDEAGRQSGKAPGVGFSEVCNLVV